MPKVNMDGEEDEKNSSQNNDIEETIEIDAITASLKRPEVFKTTFEEICCVLCCTLAVGASSIATGYSMLSLSKVSEDFNKVGGNLTWASGSIGLGSGSFLLIMGGVSDAFGRKKSIIVSFFLFAVMNLICGFLHDFIALCVVRALIGAVVSLATPSLAGVLGATYKPGKRKNRLLATFAAGAPLGFVVGLVVGGVTSQCLTWRAGHFFLTIVYGLLIPVVYFVTPLDPKLEKSQFWHLVKHLDFVGAFISLAGFTLFCFALTQVDATEKGWKTPYILVTFILGFILIVSLAFYENYIPKRPLMPMQMWKLKNFGVTMLVICLCWVCFQGVLTFYSILYFEEIKNYSPLHTTACVLTMGICGVLVNVFAAFTLHIIPGTILMLVASLAMLALSIIWETMAIDKSYWLGPFWAYMLAVIGADLAYNVANMVALSSVDHSLQSSAAGVFNTVIQLSGTVGLGISSAVVSARYPLYGTELETKYPDRLFDSFKSAYWVAFGCACLACCCCAFLRVGVAGHKE